MVFPPRVLDSVTAWAETTPAVIISAAVYVRKNLIIMLRITHRFQWEKRSSPRFAAAEMAAASPPQRYRSYGDLMETIIGRARQMPRRVEWPEGRLRL